MAIIALIVFIIILFFGIKGKKLFPNEIFAGFIPLLSSLFLMGLIAIYGWKLLLKIHPQYHDILQGFTYNGHFYITAFVALTIGVTLWIYRKFSNKYSASNLSIAPIFIWLLINFLVVFYLPGAGFFVIVVFLSLMILTVDLFSNSHSNNKVLFNTVLLVPILILFCPLIQSFPIGLGLNMMVISTVLTILMLSLMLPIIVTYKSFSKLNRLFILISILSFASASFTSGYSQDRKQPNSILYLLDVDNKDAYWASYNKSTDEFTQQFLGEDPLIEKELKKSAASKYSTAYNLYNKTNVIELAEPIVEIIKDTITGDDRKIDLKIIPQRKADRIEIIANNSLHIKAFEMNGEILKVKNNEQYVFTTETNRHILTYYFTKENEILNLSITLPKDEEPELEILEASYDLFTNDQIKTFLPNINPRNEIMMPMPFVLNDAIILYKKIDL